MEQILYKAEVYQNIGICMEVYNTLGYGFAEIVYKDALQIEFIERAMNFQREKEHCIHYKSQLLTRKFFTDFTINDSIIIEVKANKEGIADEAISQTLNYLRASGIRLGLIINFGKKALQYKRLVY